MCDKKQISEKVSDKASRAKRGLGLGDKPEPGTSNKVNDKIQDTPSLHKEVESHSLPGNILRCCPQCGTFLKESDYDGHIQTCICVEKKYQVEDFENEELANDFVCPICKCVPIYPLPIVTA